MPDSVFSFPVWVTGLLTVGGPVRRARFIGMVMLMIVSLDRPFHGELGICRELDQPV